MVFCEECGAKGVEGSKFCADCGHPLGGSKGDKVPLTDAGVAVAPVVTEPPVALAPQTMNQMMDHPSGGPLEVLGATSRITIQQGVNIWEGITQGCYEAPNTYDVFNDQNQKIFFVEEQSDNITRCCCAPGHSLNLLIHQVDGTGNKVAGAFTVARPGCVCGSCEQKPCNGCCCVCSECCIQEMTLYNGVINGPPGDIQGEAVGGAKQPICGGWFTPTLKVFNHRPGSEHHSTMHAAGAVPCIFGGASELCFDQHFEVVDTDGIDIGHIIKKKPAGCQYNMSLQDQIVQLSRLILCPALNPDPKTQFLIQGRDQY